MLKTSLTALIFCCCIYKSSIASSPDSTKVVKVDPRNAVKDQPLSKFTKNTSYIKLELTEDSMIGGVSDIIVNDDRILILDARTHSIFSFNLQGKFQFRIRNIGLGPGEYQRINQFDYNKDKKEIIIGTVGKMLFFDLEGAFKGEIKTMLGGAKRMKYLAYHGQRLPCEQEPDRTALLPGNGA